MLIAPHCLRPGGSALSGGPEGRGGRDICRLVLAHEGLLEVSEGEM